MATHDEKIQIAVGDQHIAGTLVSPATSLPGFLFVHGWRGSQEQYLMRAREVAALGCVCLAIDLRGHAETSAQRASVTRDDSLRDILAAYDVLAKTKGVDTSAIGLVGSSYGGYLAAIATSLRPVRWLALRVPALYQDHDWMTPKAQLDKEELARYRRASVMTSQNRALRACGDFSGDVLIVESEHDDVVPHPVIASYRAAFSKPRSLTYRVIKGADHALSQQPCQQAYTSLLVNWATEMIVGAREEGTASAAHTHVRPSPRRRAPRPA